MKSYSQQRAITGVQSTISQSKLIKSIYDGELFISLRINFYYSIEKFISLVLYVTTSESVAVKNKNKRINGKFYDREKRCVVVSFMPSAF